MSDSASAPGFTLTEMLVVMSIIVLLMGLLIVGISKARRQALITAQKLDFEVLTTALQAYKADFRDYPRNAFASDPTAATANNIGVLAASLVGPGPLQGPISSPAVTNTPPYAGDGADGPGFRTQLNLDPVTGLPNKTGKVWGPYMPADRFQIQWVSATSATGIAYQYPILLDHWGNPIEYFPKYRNLKYSNATGTVTPPPLLGNCAATTGGNGPPFPGAVFDVRDYVPMQTAGMQDLLSPVSGGVFNASAFAYQNYGPTEAVLFMLGDDENPIDNTIEGGDSAAFDGDFLLISAGPDGVWAGTPGSQYDFATSSPSTWLKTIQKSGNVYNFDR
jgi:prepilin-type N-terminal cleavage/methylation domain-containing protein